MNKAEISEIKKQFTPEGLTIDRICGCYVNNEKTKVFESAVSFGLIPDEEMYRYLDIFKRTLSGRRGKNLIDLSFSYEQEKEGSAHDMLYKLRESSLKDEILLDMFYDRIIESYDCAENYYIILIHAVYDVPGISNDGIMLEDASDNIYEYIACAICPVVLTKAALGYNEDKNLIAERIRDFVVDQPMKGFLFPAFNDRTADIHSMLYYTKKPADIQPEFVESVFGAFAPMSEPDQRKGFQTIIQKSVGDDGNVEIIKNIHENLSRMIEENIDEADTPLSLDKNDVRNLLEDSGVSKEKLEVFFEKNYTEAFRQDDCKLTAANISVPSKFEFKNPDIIIKINPERTDLIESRIIDGRKCLVIRMDDRVEVNGIDVRLI